MASGKELSEGEAAQAAMERVLSRKAVIQDRISGRTEASAGIAMAAMGNDAFNRAFAEELRRYADSVLGPVESPLRVMTVEQAKAFERRIITFGSRYRGDSYGEVPINYLVLIADGGAEISAYLRSEVGIKRIEEE